MKVFVVALLFVCSLAAAQEASWQERFRERRRLDAVPEVSEVSASVRLHLCSSESIWGCLFTHFFDYFLQEEALRAMMEHDNRKADFVKAKIDENRRVLKESGRRLSEEQVSGMQRQLEALSKHLQKLEAETREDKLEKVREYKEGFKRMQSSDYIDFGKTGL